MDQRLVGETAAKLMDYLAEREGEIVAVALVACVEGRDGSYSVTEFSTDRTHEQLGLLHEGIRTIDEGKDTEDADADEADSA